MPVAMSTAAGIALLVAALIFTGLIFGTLAYSVRRSWPQIRQQRERLRRSGGSRGADFDTYAANQIDRPAGPRQTRQKHDS
jgi:hypothetical protein